ncbi:MAG: hypothetical protein ABSF90_17935 [Syntrophobacteraceae bacterium]
MSQYREILEAIRQKEKDRAIEIARERIRSGMENMAASLRNKVRLPM